MKKLCLLPNLLKVIATKSSIEFQLGQKYLSNPMSTLSIETMLLVADYGNWRVVAFEIKNLIKYLGEVLSPADGIKWPVGLAYRAPYLCVTESNVDDGWACVNFFKWTE